MCLLCVSMMAVHADEEGNHERGNELFPNTLL
jgi:hypothetical protein